MRGEVLVAIMNHRLDMVIAHDQHWYRIPVESAVKFLGDCWPPRWLAFYQTKIFGPEAFAVRYYAQVLEIREVYRSQLFPDQPSSAKSFRRYYQLLLAPLQTLPQPIASQRWRRIVFIPTTWQKFMHAAEINDLYDDSPLEDLLWSQFKRLQISAERQEFVEINERYYALDFAIYCALGKLDVETDGDTWHSDPQRIPLDNLRDNDLETAGWKLFRFNTHHLREEMGSYCVPTIVETINKLGGIEEGNVLPRKIHPGGPGGERQMTLFDAPVEEEEEED